MKDDIYEYLKLDHRKVSKLFKLFESAPTIKNKIEIIALINQELLVHAESEQAIFYHALKNHPKASSLIEHAEQEHDDIKEKLTAILRQKHMDQSTMDLVNELKKIVEHHVSEEEGKVFNQAKDIFSAKEALILKLQMHDMKEKILNGEIESPAIKTYLEETNVT